MNTRRKRAAKQPRPHHDRHISTANSPAPPSREKASNLADVGNALDECVGAICLVEVSMHSLESQELASPEQEVLRRALTAIWFVHDWIYELRSNDLNGNEAEGEVAP
jgi:hypothetical protein